MTYDLPVVGVSACLLGENVRYDGGHCKNKFISDVLGQHLALVPFCPEVAIGLGVPRKAKRLAYKDHIIQCVDSSSHEDDVAQALGQCVNNTALAVDTLSGYIVKQGSPSCGMSRVKVYRNGVPSHDGVGAFTNALKQRLSYLPIEEEGRLNDPVLREHFLQRVYCLNRLNQLSKKIHLNDHDDGLTTALRDFHYEHQILLDAHNPEEAETLLQWLSTSFQQSDSLFRVYRERFMAILSQSTSRAKLVAVMEHIIDVLKCSLSPQQTNYLTSAVQDYQVKITPLITVTTLLGQYYQQLSSHAGMTHFLKPYPTSLGLRNRL